MLGWFGLNVLQFFETRVQHFKGYLETLSSGFIPYCDTFDQSQSDCEFQWDFQTTHSSFTYLSHI